MSAPVVLVLNGPNLNLLGDREPEIYGTTTLDDIVGLLRAQADVDGLALEHTQSNHEGELVDAVQRARKRCAAIIINAGALTHYSWAIHDALAAFDGYVVEVHISNPASRESWRHQSVIAPVADASICGVGPLGYEFALHAAKVWIDAHPSAE
jgi:3-dehydroquinate dehydratase-2